MIKILGQLKEGKRSLFLCFSLDMLVYPAEQGRSYTHSDSKHRAALTAMFAFEGQTVVKEMKNWQKVSETGS